ncbi:ArsR family transcriptional regulator [Flexibacter flexilis DSM 6793]|uniref:ArsR family transcriptional regulator n=1 Tax=Flexibacter flexilis DSM 6793 TaxID=927664 RepID=A0A1I1KHZ6_9BACT|nr:metalloregulator ArsR/SmtB family transcription factor [Flexibacter flexilis]SFC60614.1 ArsR family transcriptional regulator [Flexibacter flexilis DSM 6793]
MKIKNFSLTFSTQLFKALSDEARVRILFQLYHNQQMCIADLELVLDFTQTKTSRHLLYLKNAGLLHSRRTDQWIFYYIKDEMRDVVKYFFRYMEKETQLNRDLEVYRIMLSNRELAAYKVAVLQERNRQSSHFGD